MAAEAGGGGGGGAEIHKTAEQKKNERMAEAEQRTAIAKAESILVSAFDPSNASADKSSSGGNSNSNSIGNDSSRALYAASSTGGPISSLMASFKHKTIDEKLQEVMNIGRKKHEALIKVINAKNAKEHREKE